MKEITIKRWDNGEIIICGKYESIKDCLEKNSDSNLSGSNLRDSDLRDSNLSGSNLRDSDLRGSNLSGSNLRYSDLSGSNLRYSDLRDSDLRGSNLSGSNLRYSDLSGSNLRYSDLSGSNLRYSDLSGSNLSGSNLRGSDLSGSNLSGSDLSDSNLSGSNLSGSDLRNIKYKEPLFLPSLYSLKLLPPTTKLIFWKYLRNGKSPYQNADYKVGKTYSVKKFNTDEIADCGEGLNVATIIWCLKDNSEANEFLKVEFQAKDIIAIPFTTDGKFRVKKLKVLKKYTRKQAVALLKKAMGE